MKLGRSPGRTGLVLARAVQSDRGKGLQIDLAREVAAWLYKTKKDRQA